MLKSQDLTRRAAGQLLESSDEDLRAIANEVSAKLTPTVTQREAYSSPDIAIAGSALFLQLTEFAYTVWSNARARSESQDLLNQLRAAAKAMSEMAAYNQINKQEAETMVKAISSAVNEAEGEAAAR